MKILHTSDIHFNKSWFEWISDQQDNYDIFCITGDFLDDTKHESLIEQIDWVTNWMKKFKKPLFVCSGNHDIEELENEEWLNKIPNIYSDNSKKTINGIKFGCIPYIAPEFFDFDDCDVILYHVPPAKTKTALKSKNNEDWGDRELLRALKTHIISPKFLLCGHVHNPLKDNDKILNTKIFNPASNTTKEIPNYLEINL